MTSIPRPTPEQLAWQAKQFGFFCHFGINTFHNMEWSAGQLPPSSFDPKQLDAAQWVDVAQRAGARYLILTAKHHDGFCLWPTATTEYSVKNSPYNGDVVAEVSQACAAAGMAFGLYLSPWDRNSPVYADEKAYDDFYMAQMTELCTQYGELFEIWLDGAGSEGRNYDWHRIMDVVHRYQPGAVIFNMGLPTIRWIGNEDGLAEDPCYYAVTSVPFSLYTESSMDVSGGEARRLYIPPECDVPIRQNWFWQDDDLHTLKSTEHLMGIHYRSIGRGATLLLNVPPNRDGLLDEEDCARLMEVRAKLDKRFEKPLAATLRAVEGGYEIEWNGPVSFDHLMLEECLEEGQHIDGYRVVDVESGAELVSGVTIGNQKWDVFGQVTSQKVKVEFGPNTLPRAVLKKATAYLTGFETFPELHVVHDHEMWKRKVDRQHKEVVPWRP